MRSCRQLFCRVLVGISAIAIASCQSTPDLGFAVALTMRFDARVSDTQLDEVSSLTIRAIGETYIETMPVSDVARSSNIVYYPLISTQSLTLAVAAAGADGEIAAGQTKVLTLTPGHTVSATVDLVPPETSDAGGGPSLCSTFSGIACESFEDPVTDPWEIFDPSPAVLSEETGEAYRGKYAGHASSPQLDPNASATARLILETALPDVGAFYVRGFFFAATPPPTGALVPLLRVQQQDNPFEGFAVNLSTDGTINISNNFIAQNDFPGVQFPTGQWVCIEMAVTLATNGEVDLSVDGVPATALTLKGNTLGPPAANQLLAGIYFAGSSTTIDAYDFWLDEIAVDTQPIGCAR